MLGAGGLVRQQARRLELGRHVGELRLDRLEGADRTTEGLALPGVGERLVQRTLREGGAHRCHADATAVKDLQELAQAVTAPTQQVALRNAAVGEAERPG